MPTHTTLMYGVFFIMPYIYALMIGVAWNVDRRFENFRLNTPDVPKSFFRYLLRLGRIIFISNILVILTPGVTASWWYIRMCSFSGTPGLWSYSCCRHCTAWNFIWPTGWWQFLVFPAFSDWSFVSTCTFKQRPSKLKKCREIFLECGQRKAKNVVRKNKGKYPNCDCQVSKINNIMC